MTVYDETAMSIPLDNEMVRCVFATCVNNVRDMVFLTDSEGKVTYVNNAARLHFDAIGKNVLKEGVDVGTFGRGYYADRIKEAFRTLLEKKEPASLECMCAAKHYKLNFLPCVLLGDIASIACIVMEREYSGARNHLADMNEKGAAIYERNGRDERKNIQGALGEKDEVRDGVSALVNRSQNKLYRAQKMESLGVLAGGIAHEFNNILTGVRGNITMALTGLPHDHPFRKYLDKAYTATSRAADLANKMLHYSGRGRLNVKKIDLNEVIREMHYLIKSTLSEEIEIVYELSETALTVEVDVTQIRHLLRNLIDNASEAIGDCNGWIKIATTQKKLTKQLLSETYLDDGLPDGEYTCLEISDSGCGFDTHVREKLFDPFFSTKFTGRGLGLAEVLGIVRGHRGAIDVKSDSGKGSSVKLMFPVTTARQRRLPKSQPPQKHLNLGGRVLVVDDNDLIRETAKMLLEEAGYDVLVARSGIEAIEILQKENRSIDVVVLDYKMPGLNGLETFEEIKKIKTNIPVILSSGYTDNMDTRELAERGFSGFLKKPYDYNTIINKVGSARAKKPGLSK